MHLHPRLTFAAVLFLLPVPLLAQGRVEAPVIWQDRGDISRLDLSTGAGGRGREPGAEFTFIEESKSGTSPKFTIQDERGVRWKVKLGEEAKAETAAARLLWAVGYLVDEDYYLARIHVASLPPLDRGQQFVSAGDVVTGARLERDTPTSESDNWSWYDNPFVGTREFNGLRVMMALINNWDLKEVNNSSSTPAGTGAQFAVTDLGATFGRTGDNFGRSKNELHDYKDSRFIARVTPIDVDFVLRSRPFFLSAFNIRNYRARTKMERIVKHVPLADARWIGARLGRLSRTQISDCFKAAGFSPEETKAYTDVVMRRIAALEALRPTTAVTGVAPDPCLQSTCREAPVRETLTAVKLGNAYLRGILGGFEQAGGIGGGLQVTSAQAIPHVEFRAAALTSTKINRRIDLEAFLPHLGGTANSADVWLSYVGRDTGLFVTDPDTGTEFETDFAITQRSYQGSLYRDLARHLQGGVYTQFMNSRASLGPATTTSRVLSYGAFVRYDTRDDSIGLTRGVDVFARAASATGLDDADGASVYGWTERELDARGYVPLGGHTSALLLRSRAQFKSPRDDGRGIPFYDLSWLGGRRALRGYDSYRFRGNNLLLLSTELQHTVRTLTGTRGIDVFGSADAGQTWGGGNGGTATSPALATRSAFRGDVWHTGLGGGLQYRHSRSAAGRIEVSRGQDRTIVYVSLARGF